MAFIGQTLFGCSKFAGNSAQFGSAVGLRCVVSPQSVSCTRMMADLPSRAKKMTERQWKDILDPRAYHVLRQKGTEPAGSGEYDKFYPKEGHFACGACSAPLYSAEAKFNSGCGWPAFDKCYKGAVNTVVDNSFGMRRVEILCANCDSHLGHVFEGERMTDTNERHCVNSVCTFLLALVSRLRIYGRWYSFC